MHTLEHNKSTQALLRPLVPLKNQKNLKVIRHMPHNEKLKAIQMMLG